MSRFVYLFSDIDQAQSDAGGGWHETRQLLGGKGANLGDMTRLGVPVPPGFTVTTVACLRFQKGDGSLPEEIWTQELEAVRALEEELGRGFGDPEQPLLVSCRSGAPVSMPGMMDTVLNIGMNDQVAEAAIARGRDPRFVWDLYRRVVHMFGNVVLAVPDEVFERVLEEKRAARGVKDDTGLEAEDWEAVTAEFKKLVRSYAGRDFPQDPLEQLQLATTAVFRSWNSNRARDYRRAAGIPDDLGTAVNVQVMVYGNVGPNSATGVCMSRNATTGEPEMEGDYLRNAQGEDVVAGNRQTLRITDMADDMPEMYEALAETARRLEKHYKNMQDMEFTVEEGTLWLLQTRDGKRTAQAEVRIAVDMANEGLISREEAVRRVDPDQVDFFLHPQLKPEQAADTPEVAHGLNVSPGAAVGIVAMDADTAQRWADDDGLDVILVRPETKPDDVHGMLAAKGLLTSKGGRTSHAALVARQFGKPAVVGVDTMSLDMDRRVVVFDDGTEIAEREWISLDGNSGAVYGSRLDTVVPDLNDPYLMQILEWSDEFRELEIRGNADYGRDAQRAREYGAVGIGLCRTEHMFFESDRLPMVQRMIMTESASEKDDAILQLLPLQRGDFVDLFRAMDGFPVIIRLLDPPLHEFLPSYDDLVHDLADLKIRVQHARELSELDQMLEAVREKQRYLRRVEELREQNPMLGTRGVRLGNLIPNLTRMQVRAILEAAAQCAREGIIVHPEIMIPLVGHVSELKRQRELLEAEAREVLKEQGAEVEYRFGTMIEVPRAALTAEEIAGEAEFFSFGTNDLTQMTFGISRDDAESGFLIEYQQQGILPENPFHSLDRDGVGRLMKLAVDAGRAVRPDLEVGICGEHGGDPKSIALCHELKLDYVSCSPFRVPIARLAAAHAALAERDARGEAPPATGAPVEDEAPQAAGV
jgi:pyruvate,orthophosphate dikinase